MMITRKSFWFSVLAVLFVLSACATTLIVDLEQGTVTTSLCEGATFQIVIEQQLSPTQPVRSRAVTGESSDGTIQFDSQELNGFNFSAVVTLKLILISIPEGVECPIVMGDIWVAEGVVLEEVSGEFKKYKVKLGEFRQQ